MTAHPARYKPFLTGIYRIEAGMARLGTDFGNGDADGRVFQLDSELDIHRRNLEEARVHGISRYHGAVTGYAASIAAPVQSFIARRLVQEYPDSFRIETDRDESVMHCELTGDTLCFDADFAELAAADSRYVSGLDALASQVQEDLAVVGLDERGDRLLAVHVTAPNYWDPPSKLGRDFAAVHEPVAGIEPLNAKARSLFEAMARGGPFVRFAWGVVTDRRLNHHPVVPDTWDGTATGWHGRAFDPGDPELYVRVERQVLVGLGDCILFTIRPSFVDCRGLPAAERRLLADALESMSPESRVYKGLSKDFDAIVDWLRVDAIGEETGDG